MSLALVPLILGSTFGCGGAPSNLQVKPPPGGGVLVRLPGDHGFVAARTESPGSPSAGRSRTRPSIIVASFYQADGNTPMDPAPTDVVFMIGEAANGRPITLSPDPKDPNRFVSSPAEFPGGLQGSIRAKVNGEAVEESFSAR